MKRSEKPVIFVTGASRGIGAAIVNHFQERDWITVACAKDRLPTSASLNLLCDVANPQEVNDAYLKIQKHYGRLDAVINNAGVGGSNVLDQNTDDDWHHIINVNLHGTYYVSKQALNYLPNDTGRIVNIASILGLTAMSDQTAYCAAKHGVIGFTKALAAHLASRNITVNAICPGWVRTEMALERMNELKITEREIEQTIPLGGFIEPEEIACMAYYIVAGPSSKRITGHAWVVDGGLMTSL